MPASRGVTGIVVILGVFWLAAAATLPAIQDEAYYVMWARRPGFGYFDHPPLVALLTQTWRLAPGSAFAARLGTIVVAVATLFVARQLGRRCGLSDQRAQ